MALLSWRRSGVRGETTLPVARCKRDACTTGEATDSGRNLVGQPSRLYCASGTLALLEKQRTHAHNLVGQPSRLYCASGTLALLTGEATYSGPQPGRTTVSVVQRKQHYCANRAATNSSLQLVGQSRLSCARGRLHYQRNNRGNGK